MGWWGDWFDGMSGERGWKPPKSPPQAPPPGHIPPRPLPARPQCIPKERLKVGFYYFGECRNARVARWDGKVFKHWRFKFGSWFIEEIRHPDDEPHYDVFTPEFEVGPGDIPL